MEIALISKNSLRIKGKNASIFVNPTDKAADYNAAILLHNPSKSDLKISADALVIDGPGEYETGGIKISGQRGDAFTVYSLTIDGVEIVLGDLNTLEKIHQKLKEHNLAVVYAPVEGNTSFATSMAANALLFFGEKGEEAANSLAKEEKKTMTKYQVTLDKLPSETETILLASGS